MMYEEKRPTCVTVIGWAWSILGGLMCLSAIFALFGSLMMGEGVEGHGDVSFIFRIFPVLAIVQMGVGVLGLVAGINFLKLRAWSRPVLEVLTWLMLVFVVGFMVFWVFNWLSITSEGAPSGFSIMGGAMGVVITGIYGVPLGIMLRYLRGDKVRSAMQGSAEASAVPKEE
jgi:hypothetical protein